MAKTQTGRASLFRKKAGGIRVQGQLTKKGGGSFERMRKTIAHALDRPEAKVSDADTIEVMSNLCDRVEVPWMQAQVREIVGQA